MKHLASSSAGPRLRKCEHRMCVWREGWGREQCSSSGGLCESDDGACEGGRGAQSEGGDENRRRPRRAEEHQRRDRAAL
eukprot:1082614-Prorocentrum_minimum.AAC.1